VVGTDLRIIVIVLYPFCYKSLYIIYPFFYLNDSFHAVILRGDQQNKMVERTQGD